MNNLNFLSDLANDLELKGFYKEAEVIHNLFIKQSDVFNKNHMVEFPYDLDKAINKFDRKTYQVDTEGEWENAQPIGDFIEESSDELMHAPAAVDKNHIVFENPENNKIEVMNVINEKHLPTLHNKKDPSTKWIKRAED